MMSTMTRGNVLELADFRLAQAEQDRGFTRFALDGGTSPRLSDTELYRTAWDLQSSIEDRYIPASSLAVDMRYDIESDKGVYPVLLVNGRAYRFTNTAFSQLCEKSGMGVTSYMKKCIGSGLPQLVPQNINAWLDSQNGSDLLVRFCGDHVIAFLSSKYGVFDHGDALECLNRALGNGDKYQIEAHSLTIDNMSVRLVDTEKVLIQDRSDGRDKSTAGLIFRNGQTGQSLASIEFMIFTFACTNGLIVAQDRGIVYKRRHISIDKADFTSQITATLEQFPDYVAEARKDMERARQSRIDIDQRVKLRPQIQKSLGVGDETMAEIFDVMDTRWDANAWGLAGAITEVAQKFSAERQYQFEKYAGELLQKLVA